MAIQAITGRSVYSGANIATTGITYANNPAANGAIANTQAAAGNSATAGWITAKYDNTVVQIGVATKTRSGNIIFRIEGKFPAMNRPASVLATLVSAAETRDRLINIVGKMDQYRIGIRASIMPASITGSPCNVYAGIVFAETK